MKVTEGNNHQFLIISKNSLIVFWIEILIVFQIGCKLLSEIEKFFIN